MVTVKEAIKVLDYIKKEDIKKLFRRHYPYCYNKLYDCPEEKRNLPVKEVICPDCTDRVTSYCRKFGD